MKYLTLDTLAHVSELADRANGKSTSAITEALNILMRTSAHCASRVLFVAANDVNSEFAQQIAKKLLTKFVDKYTIKIVRESKGILVFTTEGSAEKILHLCDIHSASLMCRGVSYDDAIIDVDLNLLFGTVNPNNYESTAETLLKVLAAAIKRKS